jgi:hypothetical protein
MTNTTKLRPTPLSGEGSSLALSSNLEGLPFHNIEKEANLITEDKRETDTDLTDLQELSEQTVVALHCHLIKEHDKYLGGDLRQERELQPLRIMCDSLLNVMIKLR